MHERSRSEPFLPDMLTGGLVAAPLLLAYVVLPLLDMGSTLGWIPSMELTAFQGWPWLALSGGGLVVALATGKTVPERGRSVRTLLALLAGATLTLGALFLVMPRIEGPFFSREQFWLTLLPQLAPLAYLFLAGLWLHTFGAPDRRWFHTLGAVLGALVLAETVRSGMAPGLSLSSGVLLDPEGRAVRAFLLAVALLVPLDAQSRVRTNPDARELLIVAGLLACHVASALVVAGAAYLLLGRRNLGARLGVALACVMVVVLPLQSGSVNALGERVQMYMTWLAGVEAFSSDPLALLTGFGPGPLDLQLPESTAVLLGMPDMRFTLPPQSIPSFWMRLTLVWGALPGLLLLLTGVGLTALASGRAVAALMTLAMGMGLVSPLLYSGSVAMVLCLAAGHAWRAARDATSDQNADQNAEHQGDDSGKTVESPAQSSLPDETESNQSTQ